jgi:hypothetical protein
MPLGWTPFLLISLKSRSSLARLIALKAQGDAGQWSPVDHDETLETTGNSVQTQPEATWCDPSDNGARQKSFWKFLTVLAQYAGMDAVLARVGRYAVNRRVALGYKHRIDLANDLPITDRTLADIEHGVRAASPGTYAVLKNKLGWAPGSIDVVRAGGEPAEVQPVPAAQQQQHQRQQQIPAMTTVLGSVPTEELLVELRRRIVWNGDDSGLGALTPRGVG